MNGEVIREFLVGLGFDLDEASLAKFNKSIAESSLKVAAFSAGISAAAGGIFAGITGISKDFESLGYEMRLVAPALNKMLLLRQAMLTSYAKAGVDLKEVVRNSIAFNFSLEKTKYALEAVYKSVGARFLPMLTKQMDLFRSKIYANMPKIQHQLESFVKFVFRAFDGVVQLGSTLWGILENVYAFFAKLDESTNGWSTRIFLAIAAWKLLNLEFLATPLGALIASFATLLTLFDDFEAFQKGGVSFFDWKPFIPVIDAVKTALSDVRAVLDSIFQIIFQVIGAFNDLFHMNFASFKDGIINAFMGIGDLIRSADTAIKGFLNLGSSIGKFLPVAGNYLANAFSNAGPVLGSTVGAQSPPLMSTTNTGVNNKVQQETNIHINGASDAQSVGKEVASQQSNVNFDLTRNLIGATR